MLGLNELVKDPYATAKAIATELNIKPDAVTKRIQLLKKKGVITRVGPDKGGFIDFLRIITDKNDPDHDNMVEWGEEQQFERFSLVAVNEKLALWREDKSIRELIYGN